MARRRLTVIRCEPVHSGTSRSGNPYTIYEVEALDDAGMLMEDRMRSFDALVLNELIEYEVEEYRSDRQGDTLTIKPLRERTR